TAALLPHSLPEVPGMTFVAGYEPASGTVCGDWYEVELLPSGEVLFGVGDAAGHGLDASSDMSELRNAARGLAIAHAHPAATSAAPASSALRPRWRAGPMSSPRLSTDASIPRPARRCWHQPAICHRYCCGRTVPSPAWSRRMIFRSAPTPRSSTSPASSCWP